MTEDCILVLVGQVAAVAQGMVNANENVDHVNESEIGCWSDVDGDDDRLHDRRMTNVSDVSNDDASASGMVIVISSVVLEMAIVDLMKRTMMTSMMKMMMPRMTTKKMMMPRMMMLVVSSSIRTLT
jgi:hypothetical protein